MDMRMPNRKSAKICPLKEAAQLAAGPPPAGVGVSSAECHTSCAWWLKDPKWKQEGCAITFIAVGLASMHSMIEARKSSD